MQSTNILLSKDFSTQLQPQIVFVSHNTAMDTRRDDVGKEDDEKTPSDIVELRLRVLSGSPSSSCRLFEQRCSSASHTIHPINVSGRSISTESSTYIETMSALSILGSTNMSPMSVREAGMLQRGTTSSTIEDNICNIFK